MVFYSPAKLLPLAQRTGRWVIKRLHGQEVLYTTNLGSSLRFLSTASQLSITVLDNGFPGAPAQVYAWRSDQGAWHRFSAADRVCTIHLPQGGHIIELITAGNTDSDRIWSGNEGFAVVGIETNDRITAAPSRPLVNFIGDSITAGCWVNGRRPAVDYRPESNYAGLVSDWLGLDSIRIAYSAAGVIRSGTGGVPTAQGFLPQIDAATPWQVNHPRLTVINLGVNDRRFPARDFVPAYDQFVQQVRTTFPTSKVVLLVPFSQTFERTIAATAQKYRLPLVKTAGWCRDYTDDLHPNQQGALTSARHLAAVLRKLLASN